MQEVKLPDFIFYKDTFFYLLILNPNKIENAAQMILFVQCVFCQPH